MIKKIYFLGFRLDAGSDPDPYQNETENIYVKCDFLRG